jgi:hypothetical protein
MGESTLPMKRILICSTHLRPPRPDSIFTDDVKSASPIS